MLRWIFLALLALAATPAMATVVLSGTSTAQYQTLGASVAQRGVLLEYTFTADQLEAFNLRLFWDIGYVSDDGSTSNSTPFHINPTGQWRDGNTVTGLVMVPEVPVIPGFAHYVRAAMLFMDADFGTADPVNYSLSIVQSTVPEPATWAMMIVGFGMVGGMLRHRAGSRLRAACPLTHA